MSTRSYQQNCSLALTLDLLGERWTLLIVRELARGPKRFGDLKDALPGLGASMLAARLRRLEGGGIVEAIADPVGYRLTGRGERLTDALGELVLWGLELVDFVDPAYESRAAWLAMNMRTALRRGATAPPRGTFAFAVADERFWLHVGADDVTLRDGVPPHPADVTLTVGIAGFVAVATGAELDAVDATVTGDRERLARLLALARVAVDARA